MSDHVCINLERIAALENENRELRNDHTDTRESVIEMKSDMKYIKTTLNDLKIIVEKIADEPRKKWEQVSKQALSFLVGGGMIGFILWSINMASAYSK